MLRTLFASPKMRRPPSFISRVCSWLIGRG